MTARHKARKRALDVLFEADLRGSDPLETARERSDQALAPFAAYAFELVDGVTRHRAEIDQILGQYAEGWTLDRMPAVDRTVLRLGTYELLFASDVPDAVAISEAVELARELSTDASPGFVNGLLGKVASTERPRTSDSRDDLTSTRPPTD